MDVVKLAFEQGFLEAVGLSEEELSPENEMTLDRLYDKVTYDEFDDVRDDTSSSKATEVSPEMHPDKNG